MSSSPGPFLQRSVGNRESNCNWRCCKNNVQVCSGRAINKETQVLRIYVCWCKCDKPVVKQNPNHLKMFTRIKEQKLLTTPITSYNQLVPIDPHSRVEQRSHCSLATSTSRRIIEQTSCLRWTTSCFLEFNLFCCKLLKRQSKK